MASWLKAAEDLFEVVDRRAKLVVSELADEQSDSQLQAPNGQGSQTQAKRTKSKAKAQKRQSTDGTSSTSDTTRERTGTLSPRVNVTPVKEKDAPLNQNDGTPLVKSVAQQTNEQLDNLSIDTPISGIPVTDALVNDSSENVPLTLAEGTIGEAVISTPNGDLHKESTAEVRDENSVPLFSQKIEIASDDHPVEAGPEIKSVDTDVPRKIDQEGSQSENIDVKNDIETQSKVADVKVEPPVKQAKQADQKANASPMKVQEQLDEAQRLLKTASSTGQSKEARLAKVCAGLSSRLQEYKAENAQLEELLVAERELSKSYESHIKQLQQDLSESKSEATRVESNMVEALAAKNSEIEALVSSMDALKKQAALSEGNLSSLQANMESIMRNRELTETRMMQALREELASAERRAEEERAAHNATKMSSMEREVELEHRAMESSTALARIQRIADERTAKAAELEQKLALLEVECANLNQELQDMEARVRRGQKKSPEEANQAIQIQAWQDEVERARQGQREAESKLSSLDAEVQKMRVEMASMTRDAEHYSRQEHMELEKRYRELTDLLYYKQTQLETMASEKAAAEFQLEKELTRLREAQEEAERSRVSRRLSSSWEEETEMKTLEYDDSIMVAQNSLIYFAHRVEHNTDICIHVSMHRNGARNNARGTKEEKAVKMWKIYNCFNGPEPLPLHHRHMDGARVQLQKAAKLLDSGAVRATRFLWRSPKARVILLFYLVFIHLFLMYLLHRLQEQADELSARDTSLP